MSGVARAQDDRELREGKCRARIRALLDLDPHQPVVSAQTLTALAREFAAGREIPDADVLAERAACVDAMQACAGRLAEVSDVAREGSAEQVGDALLTERRRFNAQIEAVRQGLHR